MGRRNKRSSVKETKPMDGTGLGPTEERKAKANGHYHTSRTHSGKARTEMRDDTLDRALTRGKITNRQYEAGKKYRHHWFISGMAGNLQSCDLNRVGHSSDFGAGMPRTEAEAFHRKQYRMAKAALESFSVLLFDSVESFVCREIGVATIGRDMWGNRPQAEAGATERIKHGLDVLVKHFGI